MSRWMLNGTTEVGLWPGLTNRFQQLKLPDFNIQQSQLARLWNVKHDRPFPQRVCLGNGRPRACVDSGQQQNSEPGPGAAARPAGQPEQAQHAQLAQHAQCAPGMGLPVRPPSKPSTPPLPKKYSLTWPARSARYSVTRRAIKSELVTSEAQAQCCRASVCLRGNSASSHPSAQLPVNSN